jgi:hypothetical protein
VITFDSAVTGLTANDILLEATATSSSVQKYFANAVVESTKVIEKGVDETISAAGRANVLEGMTYPIPASFKTGLTLKNNPNILFIGGVIICLN